MCILHSAFPRPTINLSSLQFMNFAGSCFPHYKYIYIHTICTLFFLRIFLLSMQVTEIDRGGMQHQRCHQLQQLLKCRHNLCTADRRGGQGLRIGREVMGENGQKLARQFTRPLV